MKQYYLGIDTSNYTTSVAIVDEKEKLIYENRKLLEVKEGERGLRQSDALFQHVLTIPALFEDISKHMDCRHIKKVSASSRPRPVEGSYMPVFRVGASFGKTLAHVLDCPYREFSHQENHIKAAEWSIGESLGERFIAVHTSGGTTEILGVEKKHGRGYHIQILGGTKDISAGQLIDRIGVKLGLNFPAGKYLDGMAEAAEEENDFRLPVSVKGSHINFSGPETMAARSIEKNMDANKIAKAVFQCISASLEKAVAHACAMTGLKQVLMIGGVASSIYLRKHLNKNLRGKNIQIYFGDARYCTDHAIGTALLGLENNL